MHEPLPLSRATRVLNPGPVILLSTAQGERRSLCPIAWHMPVDSDPPTFALTVSTGHLSFELAVASGEIVICVPTRELLPRLLLCGRVSGRDRDKWAATAFAPLALPGLAVAGVTECPACLGCRVLNPREAQESGILMVEAVCGLAVPGFLRPDGTVDSERFGLLHHLGRNRFYVAGPTCTAGEDGED